MIALISAGCFVTFIALMALFSSWADPKYCKAGSRFDTYPISCPICDTVTRFNKQVLQKAAASGADYARTLHTYCQSCGANIKASWLTHDYVRAILQRAEKNQRNNELYQEFVKQLERQ